MSATCRSCQASILWATTTFGKAMPLDAEPAPDGNIVLVASKEQPGVTLAIVVQPAERVDGQQRYRSHFSACVNASKHRKPKEPRP